MLNQQEKDHLKRIYELCNGKFTLEELVGYDEYIVSSFHRMKTWNEIVTMFRVGLVPRIPDFDEFVWGSKRVEPKKEDEVDADAKNVQFTA